MGKAKKGTETNRSMMERLVTKLLEASACAARMRTKNATLAKNMATERPASVQASQEAAREFALPTPRSCWLVPSVTTPLYSTSVAHALRQTLRSGVVRELLRTPF
jgi:hypothetical protein